MGKLSSVFVLLLMINIVGYIVTAGMVEEGVAEGNPFVTSDSFLTKFYAPVGNATNGGVQYVMNNQSGLYHAVPQGTETESLIQQGITFIDRVFVLFGFIRVILGVILFPIALIDILGLGWELSMLFLLPLVTIYIFGIIDLIGGGDS